MKPTRIFDLLSKLETELPNKSKLFNAKINNNWVSYSVKDYIKYTKQLSRGLYKLAIQKGDKIASVSNNRPEWNFLDMSIASVGAVHVPIYPTINKEEYKHILKHSDVKILFISDEYLFNKINPIAKEIENIKHIFTFDQIKNAQNWQEIIKTEENDNIKEIDQKIKETQKTIHPSDLFSIIYTSGTTGVPKGVMLSHENFIYQLIKLKKMIHLDHTHSSLSFLPICHVLERIVNYVYQYLGISIYYAQGLEHIADNIKEVKPHVFVTVPRLLERVYDKIISKGKLLKGIKKQLFFWAVNLGHKFEFSGKSIFYTTQLKIANKLIFNKWREALGGNIHFLVTGGAALQPRLARIFWAAQIPVREGYGLTETAPIIAFNQQNYPNVMFGTVGLKIGNEQNIKINEDGEILFKGPNLMLGYYKDKELTDSVIKNGWFHTGDIGKIIDDKFLKITDRKKEIFKLSTGKYIAPQVIENVFKQSIFIEQIMVLGENEKFAGALISPNFEFLHSWAYRKKIQFRDNKNLIKIPEVEKRFRIEINEYNKIIGKTEQIKTFRLVCDRWSPETGELSPTLKKRRKFIAQKYEHLINEMYRK